MDEGSNYRRWDELLPDALGLIFRNLSIQEVLTVVPSVCKSWADVVLGPYCWQEIDIEDWCRQCRPQDIDRMLRILIRRCGGSLRKLCLYGLSGDQSFSFIADHAKSLQNLRLPRSEISDSMVENVAGNFSNLTFLDLSYCLKIGAPALAAIGTHCKLLTGFRRIMHPLEVVHKLSQDDEALAIASTMPKLKHLEIAYLLITTGSAIEIITKCSDLELLDLRGCWNVSLDDSFAKGFPSLRVVGPLVVDCCPEPNGNGWENCSDYSGSSGYLAWDFTAGDFDEDEEEEGDDDDDDDDDDMAEEVEMWFYDGSVVAADGGFDWPQSP